MKNKTLKKLFLFFISLTLGITGIVLACGGWDDWEYSEYNQPFFIQELCHNKIFNPSFSPEYPLFYKDEFYNPINEFDTTNVDEWYFYFEEEITRNEISELLYSAPIEDIDALIGKLKGSSKKIKTNLASFSVLKIEDKTTAIDFLNYLKYAKQCEPYATYVTDWWDETSKDKPTDHPDNMNRLIINSKSAFQKVQSKFIKQRYLFQNVRLYYFMGDYNECINYYESNKQLFEAEIPFKYRTLGYIAASYFQLKEYSKANYLYACIFNNNQAMRYIVTQSFHPQEETDWNNSLKLARNTQEKSTLWFLLGVYADPTRAIKEILEIDPKSDLLDLLLVRNLNFVIGKVNPQWNDSSYTITADSIDNNFLNLISQTARKQNTSNPELWCLSAGFLYTLQGNNKEAQKYLENKTVKKSMDTLVEKQVHIIKLISLIEQFKVGDAKAEDEIAREFLWFNNNKPSAYQNASGFFTWAHKRLAFKYFQAGEKIKAICLNNDVDKTFSSDSSKIRDLIKYLGKQEKTNADKYFASSCQYSKADLIDYLAIQSVYKNRIEDAQKIYEECESAGKDTLQADPFIIHINDCHDCDWVASKKVIYTKRSLVAGMYALLKNINLKKTNIAECYYLLGNAFYNITYFGNSRVFYDNPVNPNLGGYYYIDFYYDKPEKSNPIYDCSIADDYYTRAQYSSKNPEFKAECCFMSSKCELNNYFISKDKDDIADFKAGKNFFLLKNRYSKTKYYQEIISECGYFRTYLEK
jgi:hypothetical protein